MIDHIAHIQWQILFVTPFYQGIVLMQLFLCSQLYRLLYRHNSTQFWILTAAFAVVTVWTLLPNFAYCEDVVNPAMFAFFAYSNLCLLLAISSLERARRHGPEHRKDFRDIIVGGTFLLFLLFLSYDVVMWFGTAWSCF